MSLSATDIKNIRALEQKRNRTETGLFVVEGLKTVEELVRSSVVVDRIYSTETFDFLSGMDKNIVHLINERELERISALRSPNKILAVAKIPSVGEVDTDGSLIVALDGINDPGNLGTIIRTAKWFGVNTVLCSENCADAYDRKVVQSSMGALFHTNLHYCRLVEKLTMLKENGFRLLGTGMTGTPLNEMNPSTKTVLVIGSESHGISPEVQHRCDELITIQNREKDRKVESLNAGVAASIILYQLTERSSR